jgi:hypothetical protein
VIDGVGVVWARFFEELLEVVHGQLRLPPAIAHDLYGVLHVGAACSLIDAAVVIDCSLMAALFKLLLAGLGTLDDDASLLLPGVGRS